MKIRCEYNSIRLRLRKSEVAQLRAEKWIETTVHFPDGPVFAWELTLSSHKPEMAAQFDGGRISIAVPIEQAQAWMDTDAVSLEQFIPLSGGGSLHLLIEKDFPCKDRPEEDKADFFNELAAESPVTC